MHLHFTGWATVGIKITVIFIFMNLIHVGFTFAMMLLNPQFRNYLATTSTRGMSKAALVAVFLFLLVALTAITSSTLERQGWFAEHKHWPLILGVGMLLDFWNSMHNRRQTLGLSLLYDIRLREALTLTASEQADLSRRARREKIGFRVLAVTLFTRFSSSLVLGHDPKESWIRYTCAGIEVLVCLLLIHQSWKAPHAKRSNKTFYIARSFTYPLAALNFYFSLAQQSFHGVEYFFLTRKMLSGAQSSPSLTNRILSLGFLFGMVACLPMAVLIYKLEIPTHITSFESLPMWALALLVLGRSITFLHFYIDGFIYRFSDPSVRENILPLLKTETPQSASSEEPARWKLSS